MISQLWLMIDDWWFVQYLETWQLKKVVKKIMIGSMSIILNTGPKNLN
jgi:hypothetical protein